MDLRRRKIQPVEVGGETFHLRSWSLSDRLTWADMVRSKKPQAEIVTYVLRTSLCDADGKPTLTTETADDFDADAIAEIERAFNFRPIWGTLERRCWIINESHGLRQSAVRRLLGILERAAREEDGRMLFIFTTNFLVSVRFMMFLSAASEMPYMRLGSFPCLRCSFTALDVFLLIVARFSRAWAMDDPLGIVKALVIFLR